MRLGIGLCLLACSAGAEMKIESGALSAVLAEGGELALARGGTVFARAKVDPQGFRVAAHEHAVFGKGSALESAGLRVALYDDVPFVMFQKTLRGGDAQAVTNRVVYPSFELTDARLSVTLGTGGLVPLDKNKGSYMWGAVADPETRNGVVGGWVTTDRGSGIVRTEGRALVPHVDFGRLLLKPGAAEALEAFAVGWFDDARLGLEAYADAVAKAYDIHLPPMPTVHCTWYVDGASTQKKMEPRAAFLAKELVPFGMSVAQIDDGWQLGQKTNGPKKVFIDHDPKGPYPNGMKAIADTIRKNNMAAGIWLIPFAGSQGDPWFADKQDWFVKRANGAPYDTRWGGTCLDLTRTDTQAYLREVIGKLVHQWGYTYLKMDGLYTGMGINLNYVCDSFREDDIGGAVLSDPNVTQVQMMRNSLRLVRDTAGKDVFLLGCCVPQNTRSAGAAFGLVDAMRIGPDNGASWGSLLRGPEYGAWQYFLHGRVWYNDPDPLYVRASLLSAHARVIVSWVTLAGQMNSSSEEYANLPPDRLDLLKRAMPSHNATARPLDLFENRIPSVWHVTDGARDVIGLFNWDAQPKAFDIPLGKLGLDAAAPHIAFDFWDNGITEPFTGRLRQTLPPQSCAVLAVRPLKAHPQLISTSRHITQGIIDVTGERWDAQTATLSGTSQLVANDPYELRILTHTTSGKSPAIDTFFLMDIDTVEQKTEEGLLRVTLNSATSKTVTWRVTFSETATTPAITPRVTNVRTEHPDLFGPLTLRWESNTRACEIKRNGQVVAPAARGGAWIDDTIQGEQAYTYEVTPFTLDGTRGAPATAAFTAPPIPQFGDVPPKPHVALSDLKPLSTAVGYGAFKVNTALNGPLTLGKDVYASGICIHADGNAVYKREAGYKRFVAIVGIDESQRPQNQSSIQFVVAGEAADGQRVLASSPVLRFGQRERWHFDVTLPDDIERVVLISDSAGDGNKSDHGNWCDAGFMR
ncbi:MAG: NPCBM/NEW2 domain-containing protein [Kiritimatiellaeota bacterium]|nr:NPCBM/NEW2 domain-containing protein [Kiritimatiellota bacterium]